MVDILLDDGVQNVEDSKTHHFMNSLVHGHQHGHTESKYGVRFAWLGSVQKFF